MSLAVVTRFAPSPTGALHLGNARTAFFSWLWARQSGGRFILRIEDTDAQRSQLQFRDALLADLRWLGLNWDEGPDVGGPHGPYLQAERTALYQEMYARLEAEGRVYPCYCTPEELELSRRLQRSSGSAPRYAGTCRELTSSGRAQREAEGRRAALRFRVPQEDVVEFDDRVHGVQRIQAAEIGDFIVRREDGTAAFFFCNAVDDALMGVTQVLRGDDHLTNTPRQLLLLDALGLPRPGYGHVGLLVGADGAPLSKRHGSTSVQEFRERGFLPDALLNQLFRLGHTGDADGWLPLAAMPDHFQAEHLGRASARFDETQLLHWQKEALARLTDAEVGAWLGVPDDPQFVAMVRHNVVLPADVEPWLGVVRGDLPPLGEAEAGVVRTAGPGFFCAAAAALGEAGCDWQRLTTLVRERTGAKGKGLYMPLRIALTGQSHGPELGPLLKLMNPATARRRLEAHAQNP